MKRRVVVTIGLCLASAAVWAEDSGRIGGPVLGYVVDLAKSGVRPLLGTPGAAVVGDVLPLGFDAAAAEIPPGQQYVLAVAAERGELRLVKPGDEKFRVIADAAPGAARILFSPGGGTAALYYTSGPRVDILRGLPDAPVVGGSVDLAFLGSEPSALAISDDGTLAAATATALYSIERGGDPKPLPVTGNVSLLAFAPGRGDLYIADKEDNTVSVVRDGEFRVLAGAAEGIAGPVGMAVSAGGDRVFVANRDTNNVAVIKDGSVELNWCHCEVSGLQPLSGIARYLLTPVSAKPAWLLDAGGPEAGFWFVPTASGGDPQ